MHTRRSCQPFRIDSELAAVTHPITLCNSMLPRLGPSPGKILMTAYRLGSLGVMSPVDDASPHPGDPWASAIEPRWPRWTPYHDRAAESGHRLCRCRGAKAPEREPIGEPFSAVLEASLAP
jgi:hypothetical protein